MSRLSLLIIALFVCNHGVAFAEPVRLARTPDISPDGQTVVFSYLGDLWIVEAKGGTARHLTMHEKHDLYPVFSPDGRNIAFSSNRHGQYDVFVIPTQGGRPTRLTFDSADDFVNGWSPDGAKILFSSTRQLDFPPRQELYAVPVTGGRAERISAFEGREGTLSPDGQWLAYVRGPGVWYRKGYRGSANDDLWIAAADGSNNRQLTSFNGQDMYPQWAPDGKTLYYVSECLGAPANIVRQEVTVSVRGGVTVGAPLAVTRHAEDNVRRARLSGNGQWMVYECGPDLCLLEVKTGNTRKLDIEVNADDKTNPERITTFTNGVSEYSLSLDEKYVSFVVQGEIFAMPRGGGKAKRLTDNPAFDHGVAWAPDSRKLLFLSDRGGHENIFSLESDDPEHPELVQAHRFKVKQLTSTPEPEMGLSFSPDGKRVNFLRTGQLWSMNPDGSDQKVLMKDGQIFDYDWSPDGQWLVYARNDRFFASELFIVPGTGPTAADPPRNVTRFATYNGGVTWSKGSPKLAFISSRRRGLTSAYVLSLQKPAAPGVAANKLIDWDDIHLRVKQPAGQAIFECAISNDGNRIAYRATVDGQSDLWLANTDGGQIMRITVGNTNPKQIQWSRLFPSMLYFRDGAGALRTVNVAAPVQPGALIFPGLGTIAFQAKLNIRDENLFQEMFDQSWRALLENFYDPAFHGVDWPKMREKYRPLVRHVTHKEDLYYLVYLLLGELNASHLSISGSLGVPEQQTAELGLIFDEDYRGPGLKISEVLRGGPADRRGLGIQPGDVLLKIDGAELTPAFDAAKALNDKTGESVLVHVTSDPAEPKATRRLHLQAVAREPVRELFYERWARKNAEKVHEQSKGALGYIHVAKMDENNLDRFLRSLYSDCFDKDGIVLDVRYNSGGFTHEQLLGYLSGREHTFFSQKDGATGLALNANDRRWTKPLVLLVNNRSYSDAEIFPHAFRTLGLGKLVGEPTAGQVLGARDITLIDGSTFRTPRIRVTTHKGVSLEKEGVAPDVLVQVHPDQLARGHDPQLERAVEVLTQDVAAWKKARPEASSPAAAASGLP
ncbi:MAG: S41 family peptidase [Gemmataceae bacterium]|nr:S41 family peptidase [Gemmataceae bacterium]